MLLDQLSNTSEVMDVDSSPADSTAKTLMPSSDDTGRSRLPTHIPAQLGRNQVMVQAGKPTHHLSAADDLVTRLQLHNSYHVLLHPFRRDLKRGESSKAGAAAANPPPAATQDPSTADPSSSSNNVGPATVIGSPSSTIRPTAIDHPEPLTLPKLYTHFLPPSMPGKLKPPRPPAKQRLQSRQRAAAALSASNTEETAGDRGKAKALQEWEKVSASLRKCVFKPEYTPAVIEALDGEEGMRGFQVEAGEVEEIDRSLLEAEPHGGASPPRKKKKKGGGGHRPMPTNGGSEIGRAAGVGSSRSDA